MILGRLLAGIPKKASLPNTMPRTFLKKAAFILIACLVFGYAAFQSQNLILGAELDVASPRNDSTVTESLLTVSGTAIRVSKISLDGRQIFTDKAGLFSEEILLAPGPNIIHLDIEDRFGKKKSKSLLVMYDAPEGAQASQTASTSPQTASSTPGSASSSINSL